MRYKMWGVVTIIGCAILGVLVGSDHVKLQAQNNVQRHVPGHALIALTAPGGTDRQLVMVVDPQSRVMSVYHIDHASGAIALKSVRSIGADLMLDEFNTDSPLPREIRAMLTKQ